MGEMCCFYQMEMPSFCVVGLGNLKKNRESLSNVAV